MNPIENNIPSNEGEVEESERIETCINCGSPLLDPVYDEWSGEKFCSEECKTEWNLPEPDVPEEDSGYDPRFLM